MTSCPEALGNRFQDDDFTVPEVEGHVLDALIVMAMPHDGTTPGARSTSEGIRYDVGSAVILLKPRGRHWQRFFLDAGYGGWGEFEEDEELLDEIGDSHAINFTDRHDLHGVTIVEARCHERADHPGATSFTIRFSDGRELVHFSSDPSVLDSPTAVLLRKPDPDAA